MKIGVLTFHRCINYGSYWQARCMVDGLRARGHDAVVLDHASRRVNLAEWKCALRPTLPVPPPAADRPRYRKKIRRFFRAIESLPLSRRFRIDDPPAMERCDVVIVGSDEVWNLSHPWYGRYPLFYGEGLRTPRLVAYAASFGHHDARPALEPAWADRLRNFGRIAVRDDVSRAIVGHAIGIEPEIVLDPCLVFASEPEAPDEALPEEPYVAVYGHGFSKSFAEGVGRWARRRKLPLVSIGYRNDWADRQRIAAGPHEFAHLVAGAEAVATNFFHGCIFALRNRKAFVCEESWYRANKLRCLMAKIGGEERLLAEAAPAAAYDVLLDEAPAPAVFDRIDRLRRRSRHYLDAALAPEPIPG